jgi:hypothetical protein
MGARIITPAGTRFGRLTVISDASTDPKSGLRRVTCRCDCGKETAIETRRLRTGNTKSCGCMRAKKDPLTRFLSHVIRDAESGCWLWQASELWSTGYGQFHGDGAHRWSWRLHRGPIPKGLHVCHKCDVRPCVNPDHLFLGTPKDNMRDAYIKKRLVPGPLPRFEGVNHPNAKLTEKAIIEIRSSSETGVSMAKKFGVSAHTISVIRKRESWKHL